MFDRFRQEEAASPLAQRGLGLGLAIVRELVELHGGTVRAESAGKGQGATFTVRLPITAVRAPAVAVAAIAQAPPVGSSADLDGVRVLVVDDEVDARELLGAILEARGARVTPAASAREALDVLDWVRPDVRVSDIGMVDGDGYALIRKVRARSPERGGRVPAVALTAHGTAEDRARALLAGFQLHVPKPVDSAEFVAVVATLARRAERERPAP